MRINEMPRRSTVRPKMSQRKLSAHSANILGNSRERKLSNISRCFTSSYESSKFAENSQNGVGFFRLSHGENPDERSRRRQRKLARVRESGREVFKDTIFPQQKGDALLYPEIFPSFSLIPTCSAIKTPGFLGTLPCYTSHQKTAP